MRLNRPSFASGLDPLAVESWIMQIEKFFSILDLTEEKKVPLAAFMFTGEIEHWWQLKKDVLPTTTT